MREFPIIRMKKGHLGSIPWDMIAPHEAQARTNHCGQSLEQLASLSGLSAKEALAVLENRSPFESKMDADVADHQLCLKALQWIFGSEGRAKT